VVVAKALGLYDRDAHVLHRTTLDEFPGLFGIATLATLLIFLLGGMIVEDGLSRGQVLATWLFLSVSLVAVRAMARGAIAHLTRSERCLLVGEPEVGQILASQFEMSPSVNAELIGVVPSESLGPESSSALRGELGSILTSRSVDRVILTVRHDEDEAILYSIRELKQFGVKVSVLPPASRIAGHSAEPDPLHGITLLGMRRFEFTRSSRMIKRSFDVAGSATALLLLSPLLLLISLLVRIDSKGPILFRQARVGREGHSFDILKFRSMHQGADQQKPELLHLNDGATGLFKISNDPRVTRVGRWLRRWQLDELPQLINVLRGEMSLVGPRPLIPQEDGMIEGWYRRRLDVPPGITGHWQILGSSSRIPLAEMVKLDYLYVATWSLWGDIRLLLRTVPFMIRRGGV
jgi:exopolysaccharide biosynthesis polyprenyl glycosylphosphotransferase